MSLSQKDGKLAGVCRIESDSAGQWTVLDLNAAEYVQHVEIEPNDSVTYPLSLEISLDHIHWVAGYIKSGESAASHALRIPVRARCRYIRLGHAGGINNACRMHAYGGQSPDFINGVDVSHLPQIEDFGGKFYDRNGNERDCLEILKEHGVNYVRIKVWNKPGLPFSDPAGYNDKAHVLLLAKRVKKLGYKLLINFHYSDWWTDPGKQYTPEEWKGMGADEMGEALYAFTHDMISSLKAQGTLPEMVQVGNEITNGMVWDTAKISDEFDTPEQWDVLCMLLKKGLQAVRDVDASVRTIIHIERGGDNKRSVSFFDRLQEHNVEFDIIGLSYYPIWHGPLAQFEQNVNDLAARYNKDVAAVETAYPYTTENGDDQPNATTFPYTFIPDEYPPSVQNQANVLHAVASILKGVPDGHGIGYFYWQPDFIPVKGAGWKYGEGDEWDDQTMFDFNGHALWSLDVFRMHAVDEGR